MHPLVNAILYYIMLFFVCKPACNKNHDIQLKRVQRQPNLIVHDFTWLYGIVVTVIILHFQVVLDKYIYAGYVHNKNAHTVDVLYSYVRSCCVAVDGFSKPDVCFSSLISNF